MVEVSRDALRDFHHSLYIYREKHSPYSTPLYFRG